MNFALQTKSLLKIFGGVHAVDHLSIAVNKGDVTGIVGPNGSGKTTLINVLTGIQHIDGGAVIVGGEKEKGSIRTHEVYTLGMARTFQNVRLFEQITVMDNMLVVLTKRDALGALLQKHSKFREEQAKEALVRVGLWDKRDAYAKELSYGQRKLLEIARALVTGADVLLFDEPFAGLFPEMVKTVSGIIKELRAGEKTVVLIEHDMNIIRELCDRVIVLDAGKLLAEGAPETVLSDPKVIEAYLGA